MVLRHLVLIFRLAWFPALTPLEVTPGRGLAITKRVTTRFFTLGGAGGNQEVLDLRITDGGAVTICDRFTNALNLIALNCQRQMIGQDTASGAPPAPPGITTPNKVKNLVLQLITQYGASGLIDPVDG